MCRSWLTPVGARTGSKRIKASSCRRVWHPCHTHAPQHNLLWLARWCSSCAVPSRGCSSLCCTNKVNDAFLRGWCTFRGCAVSAAPTSKWCISARLVHFWSVGALLVCWCTSGLLVHLRQVHPLKKIPTEANLRWDFHLYVFSDIYLTSTFLDVPSLILTTLMPF